MLAELDALANALFDAEGNQRGYLLTGDESFLGLYEQARARMPDILERLRGLASQDAQQLRLLGTMEELLHQRLRSLAERIETKRAGRLTQAELPLLLKGLEVSRQIRGVRQDMEAIQQKLLVTRQQEVRSRLRITSILVWTSTAISMVFLGAQFVLMWRENRARQRAEAEARLMSERAETASRVKSQFLANMSHEIRTPMNGVLGITELLRGTSLTEPQRAYLGMIQSSSEALMRLINDILDLSKIEAGRLVMEEVPFSLRDAVEAAFTSVVPRVQAKGIELGCDMSPQLGDAFLGDPTRLTQVLTNLLGNAVKFTDRGEIVLRIREVEPGTMQVPPGQAALHFAVSDTGIGIPAEHLGSIFEAFQQADASTTRKFGGTGLGLAIAREIVSRMQGRMWAESNVGKGSTFHFTLSLKRDIPSVAAPASDALAGLRVLVVEDHATQRRVIEEMLLAWRMQPTVTAGAQGALDAVRSAGANSVALALVDAGLAGEDGFRVVEELRRTSSFKGRVLMMLPVLASEKQIEQSRALADHHVSKPFTPSRLLDAIMVAMGRSEPAALGSSAPKELPRLARSLRLLLVDDNEVNQVVARGLLERSGHQVEVAGSGAEAVARFRPGAYDAVFMDVQMPGMDGFEAARRLRLMEEGSPQCTWMVAMTAHAMKGDREHCLAEGMDDYVAKPIQMADLQRVLAFVTSRAPDASRADCAPPAVGAAVEPEDPVAVEEGRNLLGRLAAGLGDDDKIALVAAKLMCRDMPLRMSEIEAAVGAGLVGEALRGAHTLRSHFQLLGAASLAQAMQDLEVEAAAGTLASAPEILQRSKPQVLRMARCLEAQLASLNRC
jgi:signal transduction histidine kinase/CheY-like chemotaxis protein